jgi:hypothetical protein
MINTEQTKGLSVLDHGFLVSEYFLDLYNHIIQGKDLNNKWKLPEWFYDPIILGHFNTLNLDLCSQYQVYHDCGKPYCLTIDDEGKRHFPDHSNKSYSIYTQVFGKNDFHHKVAELIKDDMLIHLLKNEGVSDFIKNKNHLTLLLTGLSEIHANSEMFGGIDSTSFKIKWKHINKRGKAILIKIKEEAK